MRRSIKPNRRVEVKRGMFVGAVGKVLAVFQDGTVAVQFKGSHGGSNCFGLTTEHQGRFLPEDRLEVTNKPLTDCSSKNW